MKQSIQKNRRSHGTLPSFSNMTPPSKEPRDPATMKTCGGNKDVWFHRVSLRFSGVHWEFTSTHCCFSANFMGYHRDIQRTKNWIIKGVHHEKVHTFSCLFWGNRFIWYTIIRSMGYMVGYLFPMETVVWIRNHIAGLVSFWHWIKWETSDILVYIYI